MSSSDEWNEAKLVELSRKIEHIGNYEFNGLMVTVKLAKTSENLTKLAEKLGISLIDEPENRVHFRPIHVIPHIVTLVGIVRKSENCWFLIYDQQSCQDDVPFETLLRYSYSNLSKFDLQRINFLSHSLLETYTQVFQRGIQTGFRIENFKISTDLWIKYDVFGEFVEDSRESSQKKESLEEIQCKWIKREISNFEYLEILNQMAGRVRGEVHNHPVFPWVTDFCGNLRPLNRTKYRLNKGDDQLKEMYSREPSHHVPELLSDIGYMSYRARIESKENLCRYVRRKWVPEEYPTSIARMYQWTPDECIPEFYESPAIFTSIHPDMTDLKLPDFISSPEEFIKYHRGILESEEVSMNLHRWIDLVFGVLLSEEQSVQGLNRHLCYVQKNPRGLRTYGMVQLFQRAHPQRNPEKYDSVEDENRRILETGFFEVENINGDSEGKKKEEGLYEIYRNARSRDENGPKKEMMKRIVELIALLTVSPHMVADFSNFAALLKCAQHAAYSIPANYRNLIDQYLVRDENWPEPEKFAFLIRRVFLNLPAKILDFHVVFGQFQAFHGLRKMSIVGKFSKRSQVVLLKEVDYLKKSIRKCHFLEFCVVTAFQNLLEDEEACIQAVHKLMPVITRCLSQSALEDLINPMIELIQSDTSVKLLDRRFLLSVSICYGSRKFVDLFIPPIIEACASRNENRSIVAKESIMWLAKRYGPIICAKFITSNLLRIIASCFEGLEVAREERNVFAMILEGDSISSRLESILSEIVLTWSVTFITVQYLPFCVDLIEIKNYKRRAGAQFETGIISVFRIVDVSVRGMTDNQLMTYLEEYIVQKVLSPVISILLDLSISFSSDRARNVILCKFLQLLFFVSQRIGTENTRIYASEPFKKLFETFSELYEANEELMISPKTGSTNLYPIPVWIVRQVIDKFTEVWSVPFLSQFCPDPAFLIPFVSATSSSSTNTYHHHLTPSPSAFNMVATNISGNRLFSLSSSNITTANHPMVPTIGGVSNFYGGENGGTLSQAWCAKISAAVCGASTERFDHLTLGTFSGHNADRIRKLAAISNENSFASASSDKTVKLWSIKPEQDEVECQWTYRNHTKPVVDVTILADNLIASTDGNLHIWDPFRATILAQTEWDSDGATGAICALANVDRHTVATISSLNSTIKLFDTRIGAFSSELKVTPGSGVTRAMAVKEHDHKLAVAMSNGNLAILDARNGKITLLAQIHSTHVNGLTWINNTQLLIADADDAGIIVETRPYGKIVRKLADTVVAAAIMPAEQRIVTLQANSMLRIYKSHDVARTVIDARIRSDQLAGHPTAILPLALNSAYLIGSSHGQIKIMC